MKILLYILAAICGYLIAGLNPIGGNLSKQKSKQ